MRRVDGWSQWLKLSYCGQLSQLDSPAVTSCHPHSAVCQIFSVSLWIWDTPDHSRWFRYDEQIFFLTHQDYCTAPVPGTVLISSSLSLLIRLWCITQCSETVSDCSVIIDKLSWLTQLIISVSDVRRHWRRRLTTIKMSSFKPKLYRSQEGCCICKAKSSRWQQIQQNFFSF